VCVCVCVGGGCIGEVKGLKSLLGSVALVNKEKPLVSSITPSDTHTPADTLHNPLMTDPV